MITCADFKFPPVNLHNMPPTNAMIQYINNYYAIHFSTFWS